MSSSNPLVSPRRILPVFQERIWGSKHLEPWFRDSPTNIGEVWFQQSDSTVLVKFIFATENLSVQVHPDDALARRNGHLRGKTEMWHILQAAPQSKIALGFKRPVDEDRIRRAAVDGSIMDLINWLPVEAGQTWFIPAGTVHAIGAGVTLCEVQQNSDVTYRLFDYGRNRELHLEKSLQALNFSSEPPALAIDEPNGRLVDCSYFQVDQVEIAGDLLSEPASFVVVLSGTGTIDGEPFRQGEVYRSLLQQPIALSGQARVLTVLTKT